MHSIFMSNFVRFCLHIDKKTVMNKTSILGVNVKEWNGK